MDITAQENDAKHEVVAAYNEVLRKLQVIKNDSPEETEEAIIREQTQAIVAQAAEETPEELVSNLNELKLFINKSLEEIKNKLLPKYKRFQTLSDAIEISEKTLKHHHDITVNIHTLEALLTAHRERRETFEREMIECKMAFDNEMAKKERLRIQEEQEYLLKRDSARKIEIEQYEAMKRDLERELHEKRTAFEEEMDAREARIAARESEHQQLKHREAQITAREHEFKQLREKASRYPIELRTAIQQTEQATTDKLTRKYEYDIRLLRIELDSERKIHQQKIAALEEQIGQYKSLKQMFNEVEETEQ